MKKFTLFVASLLVSAFAFAADDYCGETVKSTAGEAINYTVTIKKASDLVTSIIVDVPEGETINGFFQFIVQNPGGGAAAKQAWNPGDDFESDIFSISEDGKQAVVTFTWTTYPTDAVQIHYILRRDNSKGGSDIFGTTLTNINVSATCEGCELTENPTMVAASLAEASFGSATLNVSGKDQLDGDITKFIVKSSSFDDTQLVAVDGVITIEGLSPNTSYTVQVYAKDKCNNVSEEGKEVAFTTTDAVAECSGVRGHFGNPTVSRIAFEFVSNTETGKAMVAVSPVDPTEVLAYAEVQLSAGGNHGMTINTETNQASYEFDDNADIQYALFLYRFESMAGNEMTAENLKPSTQGVIVYKKGACTKTAVEEVSASSLSIYPNPASQFVNIASDEVIAKIQVRAQSGVVVAEVYPNDTFYNLAVSELNPDRYIVTIFNGAKFETQTIVVK